MEDNHSFLYPQGFHMGALFFLIKNLGNKNFNFPFNQETYSPQDYGKELGTFEREFRYRVWALMEMGILEDGRITKNNLSYQKLTEKGINIYNLMKDLNFPDSFFERKSDDSWAMTLNPIDYINFTKKIKEESPSLFKILHETIINMDACQDLISYFISEGRYKISKNELYGKYFSNDFVRETYSKRKLTLPKQSYETARRRISIIIGLLESVGVLLGYSSKVEEDVVLLESSEDLTEERDEKIEQKTEYLVREKNISEINNALNQLEEKLPTISPSIKISKKIYSKPTYPRHPALPSLLKKKRDYTCQICGEKGFEKPNGILFISHHHMIPMNKGIEIGRNPDVPSNILIVCSWCHDKLEYANNSLKKKIYEELLTKKIIDKDLFEELRSLNLF